MKYSLILALALGACGPLPTSTETDGGVPTDDAGEIIHYHPTNAKDACVHLYDEFCTRCAGPFGSFDTCTSDLREQDACGYVVTFHQIRFEQCEDELNNLSCYAKTLPPICKSTFLPF